MTVALVVIAVVATWAFALSYNVSDRFHVFVRRLFRAKGIHVRSGAERFVTVVETDAWGEKFAYRYPTTRVGFITLMDDGTGQYYGPIKWRPM